MTDPNNRLTKNLYDGVGRLIEVDQSDAANPSLLATSTTYQYTDNSTPPSVIRRTDYLHGHEHDRHLLLLRRPQPPRAGAQILADRRHLCRQ